jgi:hypothetical protein
LKAILSWHKVFFGISSSGDFSPTI